MKLQRESDYPVTRSVVLISPWNRSPAIWGAPVLRASVFTERYKEVHHVKNSVTGDSDFVPAAKLARREGIDVVLDPLEMEIGPNSPLLEHIDGLRSCGNPYPRTHMLPPVTVDLSTRQ